ncbi:MAG: hypothetical protein RR740_00360 [Pseudomonas sp.]
MPLIKGLNVDADLCGDTYRRREFIIQQDYVRRVELGKDVSIRTSTMKGALVIETLRAISEDHVRIDQHAQEAYADAEDWLTRKMTNLFQTVRGMAMHPHAMTKSVSCFVEKSDGFQMTGREMIWIPACAFYIGDERVYIFRTMQINRAQEGALISHNTAGAVGYTRDYLNKVSPELSAYVNKLESKAMEDPEVRASFTRLGSILRPEAYAREMLEERQKQYADKAEFGAWT